MTRPHANEAASYYSRYISLISEDDILGKLKSQLTETKAFLDKISDERSLHTYAPDKWTIRQVVNHVSDSERVFTSRAFWFARGFPDALPGFDQDICVQAAGANDVSWEDLKDEFTKVRLSTISLFENLPPSSWMKTGIANDTSFTVNALSYIIAGHVAHHLSVITSRYL